MTHPLLFQATNCFDRICPQGCSLTPVEKDLYVKILVDRWPTQLHYEFRLDRKDGVLFDELHIENKNLVWLGNVLNEVATKVKTIQGFALDYAVARSNKKWPSLRIEHAFAGADGDKAAQAMLEFINKSRDIITRALLAA
ncbi:hypothetical protein [Solidesulfovibrio sp. C21]|uniref:hypothetical protein n=1 Tax=Solidesulfovibrio sp. C21 TaxID=3398613 RepID=UPI0039FCF1D7